MKYKSLFILALLLCSVSCKNNPQLEIISEPVPADEIRYTGAGGGGAMFYPAVSPHDPGYAFIACDMTGSYVTYNGGESWKMFSLRAPVKFFVFDPVDTNVVYAGSIGLFKSSDRGKSWNIIYPPADEITGYVTKGDHAEEVIVTKDSTRRRVLAVAVDPGTTSKLHAVVSVSSSFEYLTSDDNGATWRNARELPGEARSIFIDPSSPGNQRTIYIAGPGFVLERKNGEWKSNSIPSGVKKITEYSGGYDKSGNRFIIYAVSGESYFNPDGDLSGIWYTADGGRSWENRQSGIISNTVNNSPAPEWRTVATSAQNPSVVYISYSGLKSHADTTCIGVAKSEDFGKTWKLAWQDRMAKGGAALYSPNYSGGWIDERFNPTWGENPFSIGVSATNPDVCYTTDFGRTIKTSDGGKTWQQVYTRKTGSGWFSRGLEVTTGYTIVTDPFDLQHIFIANTDIGLMESTDGGNSWNSATINNGIPKNWVNSTYWIAFDPDVRGRAWAAMSPVHDLPRPKMWRRVPVDKFAGGLVTTEDGGKTWAPISNGIGEAAFTHIFPDKKSPSGSRILYACAFGKGVYKSVDGGKSWQLRNKGIKGKQPFAWRIEKNDASGALYLVVSRRSDDGSIGNDMDGAIYKSDDGAETWSRVNLPEGTNGPTSIVSDPSNSSRLLLSAWGRPSPKPNSPDNGGGIFLSVDNGVTWKNVLGRDQHIHDITFDSRSKTWYACGFNGSAYFSKDGGGSWERLKGYNFKWGKRVDPDPADSTKVYIITFGGGVWHGPALGNEKSSDDIVTGKLSRD